MQRKTNLVAVLLGATLLGVALFTLSCSALNLGSVVRPPRFAQAPDHAPELRLSGPSSSHRAGSASIRLWAQVENPNPFGVLLDRLEGSFFLEDARAADVSFPLGLDLGARDQAVVPIEITVDLNDLGGIASVLRDAASARRLGYRVEGTVGVDAGPLGGLTYGPADLFEGTLDAGAVLRAAVP